MMLMIELATVDSFGRIESIESVRSCLVQSSPSWRFLRSVAVTITITRIPAGGNIFRDKFKNSHFYVLFMPGSQLVGEFIPYFEAAGIKYLDYSKLIDSGNKEFTFEYDTHPTAKGYRAVAAQLVKDLGLYQ